MRYMGDATPAPAFPGLPATPPGMSIPGLDAAARAQLIAQASLAPDDQAQLLLDMTDATALGHRTRTMRYGVGALVGGVVVGLGVFLATR